MKFLQRTLLELVYPSKCALCGVLTQEPVCGICFSHFDAHDEALGASDEPLGFACALYNYTGVAASAVQRFKYSRTTSLGKWMAAKMAEGAARRGLLDADVIIPIPIHWRRRAYRGFNQAEILASLMPQHLINAGILRRTRPTKPQVGLNHAERASNLSGAFEVHGNVRDRSILLIDDVLTSGGTAKECARALRAADAREVGILAFAGKRRWRI